MPAGPQPKTASKPAPVPALIFIVIAQAAAHLALLPVSGWISDTRLLQTWAVRLLGEPVSRFYASEKRADHLPGDLWILRLEAWVYHIISGNSPSNSGFLAALKLGPGLADIGIAIGLYLIAREIGGGLAGRRAALFFALNPAPYFISMIWGVADSVSMLFAVLALWLTIRKWFWAAVPALTYACLIKPQLGILAPLLLIFFLHEAWRLSGPRRWRSPAFNVAAGGGASLVVLLATLLPFHVGVPFVQERWSLAGRINFSAGLYSSTTMNALNLWAFISAPKLDFPADKAPSDSVSGLFGLSYQHWAILLTAIVCVVLALPLIRKGGAERLIWTCTTVTFAFFMLQTRMHERYFFPTIALMALVVAFRPRLIPIYGAMSAVYFGNLWWVYHWLGQKRGSGGGISGFGGRVISHAGIGNSGGRSADAVLSPDQVRALAAVNLAVLGFFVVHAILDFRKPAPLSSLVAEPMLIEPSHPYPEWPGLLEHQNQHPI